MLKTNLLLKDPIVISFQSKVCSECNREQTYQGDWMKTDLKNWCFFYFQMYILFELSKYYFFVMAILAIIAIFVPNGHIGQNQKIIFIIIILAWYRCLEKRMDFRNPVFHFKTIWNIYFKEKNQNKLGLSCAKLRTSWVELCWIGHEKTFGKKKVGKKNG